MEVDGQMFILRSRGFIYFISFKMSRRGPEDNHPGAPRQGMQNNLMMGPQGNHQHPGMGNPYQFPQHLVSQKDYYNNHNEGIPQEHYEEGQSWPQGHQSGSHEDNGYANQIYPPEQFANEEEYVEYMQSLQRQGAHFEGQRTQGGVPMYQNPHYNQNYNQMMQNQMVQNQMVQNQGYPQHMQNQGYPPHIQSQGEYYPEEFQGRQEIEVTWQKKFMVVFERFEWEYQRFEILRGEYIQLCEQLKTVDSEQDWNQLKQHHDDLLQKFNQTQEELIGIIHDNMQLAADQNLQFADIWEQRYHELLANYKALEQEMIQRQQSQVNKQNYDQRREQQLAEQYRKLQIEYANVSNELQRYRESDPKSSQIDDYRQKLQYALEEGEKYKSILDKLHQENEEMQTVIGNLETQNNALKRQVQSRTKVSVEEYQNLLQITSQKEEELSEARVQRQMTVRQNKKLIEQLQIKSEQIDRFKQTSNRSRTYEPNSSISGEYNKIIQMKSDQISQYKSMLKSAEEDFKISMEDKERTLIRQYQQKLNTLSRQIKRLQTKVVQSQDLKPIVNAKIEAFQKKVAYYEQQVNNLNSTLLKKNQQILQMRGQCYQIQKAKNFQLSYLSLEKQRDQLKSTLNLRKILLQEYKGTVFGLQSQVKDQNSRRSDSSAKFLNEQIENLKQMLTKKDFEISKSRQSLQNKENQIIQVQNQAEKYRSKLNALQKSFQNQRVNVKSQLEKLEGRNKEYEKKIRHLQFQYGDAVKNNLQNELNSLRIQNQTKQESINRLEASEIDLKSRLANTERQKKDTENDVLTLKSKIDEFERWKAQYLRQMEQSLVEISSKETQIKDMQSAQISSKGQFMSLKEQVNEYERTLRDKNHIIKDLESKSSYLSKKIDDLQSQNDRVHKQMRTARQESQTQRFKLNEQLRQGGPNSSFSLVGKSRNKVDADTASYEKMISVLRNENQRLKQELAKLFEVDYQRQPGQELPSRAGEGLNYIQIRLQQFNNRLEGMLRSGDQELLGIGSQSPARSRKSAGISNNNISSDGNYKADFNNLKEKLGHLRKYCATLEVKTGDNKEIIEPNAQYSQVFNEQERVFNRQLQFYKSKAEDFQSRVDHLIQVNTQLKSRVESLLSNKSEFSSVSFYKEEVALAEKSIELLTNKVKKLSDQNRALRQAAIETHSKVIAEKEKQIDEQNLKIQQLNRKVRQLQLDKTSYSNEKSNMTHQLNQQANQFKLARANLEEKLRQYEGYTNKLAEKCNSYELQLKGFGGKSRKQDQTKFNLSKQFSDNDDRGYASSKYEITSPTRSMKKEALLRDLQCLL